MNLNSILGNFVKFVRGTPTAYNNLQQKNPDTLYFITENNASSGKLYLGNKLIGGSITGATSLLNQLMSSQIIIYRLIIFQSMKVTIGLIKIFEIFLRYLLVQCKAQLKILMVKQVQYLRRRPINRTLIFEEMEHGIILQPHILNKLIL